MNTYIQDKLDEFDDRFAIIVDEKIDGKVYLNRDYGDFYGQRDELKDFIKEMFTDYHNHIVEKLLKHFDKLEHNDTNDSMENWRNYKFIRNNIVDCLQDTNAKE